MGSLIRLFRKQKNNKQDFDRLLSPHIETMYRMAYHWTQSQEDAEDLIQDVLIKLANRVDEMSAIEQLRPWLIKVVYRRFIDLYRRERNSPLVDVKEWSTDEDSHDLSFFDRYAGEESEEKHLQWQDLLIKALATLDEDQRDIALLHFVEGYTAQEAAEILGVNLGTIKSRLQRARIKLKKFLTSEPF